MTPLWKRRPISSLRGSGRGLSSGESTRSTGTSSCPLSSVNPPSVFTAKSSSGERDVGSLLPTCICVVCKLYLILSLSVYRGVFGKQGYQCQGEKTLFSLSAISHISLNIGTQIWHWLFVFSVCTCVVHKRCHQHVVTVCPRMKKSTKEQVRPRDNNLC